MQRIARMKRELKIFEQNPPHGISCWMKDDQIDHLEAQILGSEGTPYYGGIFKLDIQIPERYPFEPPKVRFVTAIYHPNIDSAGRICLDSLKMPPKGAWKPALNISTLLTTIQLLMNEPNPEDPLMADIAEEFKYNKSQFEEKAKDWTAKYAKQLVTGQENLDIAPCAGISVATNSAEQESDIIRGAQGKRQACDARIPLQDDANKRLKT